MRRVHALAIGVNGRKRTTVAVHRVVEQSVLAKTGNLTPTTYVFRYPDGAHDSETLLVNPTMGGTPTVFGTPSPGESITAGFTAGTVFSGQEGKGSKIWRVTLP